MQKVKQDNGSDIVDKSCLTIKFVTVQPFIYYIRKPVSKLSVAAMQLEFTSFHKRKAILPQKTSQ